MRTDGYGTAERQENMDVMSEPVRGSYTMDDEHFGKVFIGKMTRKMNMERRVRWVRRLWWDWSDELGIFLWIIVGVMIAGGIWWVYGSWPR